MRFSTVQCLWVIRQPRASLILLRVQNGPAATWSIYCSDRLVRIFTLTKKHDHLNKQYISVTQINPVIKKSRLKANYV